MDEKLKMTIETPDPVENGNKANPSYYLDRAPLTILMTMKLIEGLTKLSIAVICAFMLHSVVSALNTLLSEGTVNAKAMAAQILRTLRVPMENIRQVVAAIPSNYRIPPNLPVYLFVLFLPFVVISVLEAVALIRLRLGKGGTRTIGILHWIYCALDAAKLLALTLLATVLSLLSIIRIGGTLGIMIASVIFSLAVLFLPIRLPAVLYHRSIAGIMKDVRYEMKTGMQTVRRWINFRKILGFMIALEVAGTIISIMAYWRPTKQDPAMITFIMIILFPALKLVKYICVMFFYRNFMQSEGTVEAITKPSHKPQHILIALVTLVFVIVNGFVGVKSASLSKAMVERGRKFFNDAQQTVDEISSEADQKINEIQQAIESQTGAEGTSENPQPGTTENPQPEAQGEPEGTTAAPGTGAEEKTEDTESTESTKGTKTPEKEAPASSTQPGSKK